MDPFWISLLFKAAITAAVIVTAGFAAERGGPFWAGLIAAFPVAAGPAYILLALQSDAAFISHTALSSLVTNAANVVFILALVGLLKNPRIPAALAVVSAVFIWSAAALPLRSLEIPWTIAMVMNIMAFAFGVYHLRKVVAETPLVPKVTGRWFDLPLRGVLVGAFVAVVVAISAAIGPVATGVMTVFPIMFTSLVVVLISRLGRDVAAVAMASGLKPLFGLSLALLTMHLSVEPWGKALGLLAAFLVSMAWLALMIIRRKARV